MKQAKVNLNVRLNTLFTKLGLNTAPQIKEYMVGRRIIPVVNNSSGQSIYPLNEAVEIDNTTVFHGVTHCAGMPMKNGYAGGQAVYWSECILAPEDKVSITRELEYHAKREKELEMQKSVLIEKLAYLSETKAERVEATEFKKYLIKKVFSADSKETIDEKVSKVMELLSV